MRKKAIKIGNRSDLDANIEIVNKRLKKEAFNELFEKTELYKLNEQMKDLRSFDKIKKPKEGWLKYIRTTLNIPLQYIADELGIKAKQSVADFEDGEIRKSISLDKLEKYANKMGFRLVYYLEPIENTPLEIVRKKVEESIKRMPEKERAKYIYNPNVSLEKQGHNSRRKELLMQKVVLNIPKSLYISGKAKP